MGLKGFMLRGAQVRGAEYIDPSAVPNLRAWYKWKTGITIATGVSQWSDQSGNGFHLLQATGARQPVYDSGTGLITFDGSNDYMQATSLTFEPGSPEYTFVIKPPASLNANPWFGRSRGTGVDTNGLHFTSHGTSRYVKKEILAGTGLIRQSVNDVLTSGVPMMLSMHPQGFWINNVELLYSGGNSSGGFGSSSNNYYNMGAATRNSGGSPSTPLAFAPWAVYEWCWHDQKLTDTQRGKLLTYMKQKIGF